METKVVGKLVLPWRKDVEILADSEPIDGGYVTIKSALEAANAAARKKPGQAMVIESDWEVFSIHEAHTAKPYEIAKVRTVEGVDAFVTDHGARLSSLRDHYYYDGFKGEGFGATLRLAVQRKSYVEVTDAQTVKTAKKAFGSFRIWMKDDTLGNISLQAANGRLYAVELKDPAPGASAGTYGKVFDLGPDPRLGKKP